MRNIDYIIKSIGRTKMVYLSDPLLNIIFKDRLRDFKKIESLDEYPEFVLYIRNSKEISEIVEKSPNRPAIILSIDKRTKSPEQLWKDLLDTGWYISYFYVDRVSIDVIISKDFPVFNNHASFMKRNPGFDIKSVPVLDFIKSSDKIVIRMDAATPSKQLEEIFRIIEDKGVTNIEVTSYFSNRSGYNLNHLKPFAKQKADVIIDLGGIHKQTSESILHYLNSAACSTYIFPVNDTDTYSVSTSLIGGTLTLPPEILNGFIEKYTKYKIEETSNDWTIMSYNEPKEEKSTKKKKSKDTNKEEEKTEDNKESEENDTTTYTNINIATEEELTIRGDEDANG